MNLSSMVDNQYGNELKKGLLKEKIRLEKNIKKTNGKRKYADNSYLLLMNTEKVSPQMKNMYVNIHLHIEITFLRIYMYSIYE